MTRKRRPPLTPEQRAAKQQRDREYRARKVAQARERGESIAAAYGHRRAAGPRRTVRGPGGETVYRTGNKAVALRLLKQAAAEGKTISIRGTFQTEQGWRHATLDGGTSAQRRAFDRLLDEPALGAAGDLTAPRAAPSRGARRAGRPGRFDPPTGAGGSSGGEGVIEIRIGGQGFDAQRVLDAYLAWLDEVADPGDDWWDFLDWWADHDYA